MIRIEWCACGGVISVAVPASEEEIFRAVWTHNNTVRHRVWRERGGLAATRGDDLDGYERRAVA